MANDADEPKVAALKLSPRQAASLLLVGVGAIMVMVSGANGWPTFVAWLMMWAGSAWMIDSRSSIVRYGGSFIASLVLLLITVAGTRGLAAVRAWEERTVQQDASAPPKQDAAPMGSREEAPAEPPVSLPAASAPLSAKDVAASVGGRAAESRLIKKLASRYRVEPIVIGDKAAKAAELCLGGKDAMAANPSKSVRLISDSLYFAENASRDGAAPDKLPLDDAFVMFVAMGCKR
jgi:hypothetical protein